MSVQALSVLLQQFGPLVGVLLFFIWRDWTRETKLSHRITKLEDDRQTIMLEMVEKSTSAIVQNSASMEQVSRTLERLCNKTNS